MTSNPWSRVNRRIIAVAASVFVFIQGVVYVGAGGGSDFEQD